MGRNVTLRLDEAVIRKARHAAVELDQSLSEWVTKLITNAVAKEERTASARDKALRRMERPFHLGGSPLSREETHER